MLSHHLCLYNATNTSLQTQQSYALLLLTHVLCKGHQTHPSRSLDAISMEPASFDSSLPNCQLRL
jgi:hypothetical protein